MNWNQIASSWPAELGTDDDGDVGHGVPGFPQEPCSLPGLALLGLPFNDANTWVSDAGRVSSKREAPRAGVAWDRFPSRSDCITQIGKNDGEIVIV